MNLDSRSLLASTIALVLSIMTVSSAFGQSCVALSANASSVPSVTYSVVSVRENHSSVRFREALSLDSLTITNAPLVLIIKQAYGLNGAQDDDILGLPDWARAATFDISAKVDETQIPDFEKLSPFQKRLMLQTVLSSRFLLSAHCMTKTASVLALKLDVKGAKLEGHDRPPVSVTGTASTRDKIAEGTLSVEPGWIKARGIPLSTLAIALSGVVGQKIVDHTGLTGTYNMTLQWNAHDLSLEDGSGGSLSSLVPTAPSLSTALKQQLGLQLVKERGSVDSLQIDHIEKLSSD